jgi:predicted MPP superfamily phosphohydrolase
LLDLLLFGFVWLGHACCWLVIINVIYSQPIHKAIQKICRAGIGVTIFFVPPIVYFTASQSILDLFSSGENLPLAIYLGGTILISAVLLPIITVQRNLRGLPRQVLSETTRSLDIEKEFGYRPIGDGKKANWLARKWNQFFTVDFTTLTLRFPDLPPEWDGLTILHLSDLHFIGSPSQDYFRRVFRECMDEGTPDLVVITGDIIDSDEHLSWVRPLLGDSHWKIAAFAILGNHDWWYDYNRVRELLRELGFHEVGNRWETIPVKGIPLTVIGHEGPWFRPPPDLGDAPPEGFRLCLSHTPDNYSWCRRHQIRLMLSGHNHGGQIRLPWFGSLFVPSRYSRRYDMGTFYRAPTLLHVNRGLGGKDPIRIRCNPQVTRIILKRGETA